MDQGLIDETVLRFEMMERFQIRVSVVSYLNDSLDEDYDIWSCNH